MHAARRRALAARQSDATQRTLAEAVLQQRAKRLSWVPLSSDASQHPALPCTIAVGCSCHERLLRRKIWRAKADAVRHRRFDERATRRTLRKVVRCSGALQATHRARRWCKAGAHCPNAAPGAPITGAEGLV
jgi:hypothetical protein